MHPEKKISILLVDDAQNSLIALEAVLYGLAENIVSVTSGEMALAYLLKEEFAVVVLDIQMPGIDGLETARRFRQHSLNLHTPIIFISSLQDDQLVLDAYRLGVDFLLKPLIPEILRAKVSVFIDLYKKNVALEQQYSRQVEASQIHDRLQFLCEASNALASSLDYQTTLNTIANLAVPRIADWCLLEVVAENSQFDRLALAHNDPAKTAWLREIQQNHPIDIEADAGVARVLRTGKSVVTPEVPNAPHIATSHDAIQLEAMRENGIRSTMVVPMSDKNTTIGAITFVSIVETRLYDAEDLAFAEELAQRAALAVSNARRYLKAQQAEELHRTIEDQLMLLMETAGRLISTIKSDELLTSILALSRKLIAADAYAVWRFDHQAGHWQIACASGLSQQFQDNTIKKMPPDTVQEQPYIFEDVDSAEIVADRRELYHVENIKSVLAMPLIIQGERSGTITFYYHQSHHFSEVEIRLATALSNLAAAAITTAELYAH